MLVNILLGVVAFVGLTLIVIGPHELGHLLTARRLKISTSVFSFGFGPTIWSRTTTQGFTWRVGLMPLGGYVRFRTENAPQGERLLSDCPPRAIALVALAGPAVNIALGILILLGLALGRGPQQRPPIVGALVADQPAAAAGLQPGDRILAVNGFAPWTFRDIPLLVGRSEGGDVSLRILRNGSEQTVVVVPTRLEMRDEFGARHVRFQLGILGPNHDPNEALLIGLARDVAGPTRLIGFALWDLIHGLRWEQVGGGISIATTGAIALRSGLDRILTLLALLSIQTALINLLPIPGTDGWHLLRAAGRATFGRTLPKPVTLGLALMGVATFLGLFVLGLVNDLRRFQ